MVGVCCINWNEIIQTLATSVSALVAVLSLGVALIAVWYTNKEYKRAVRNKQSEVLAQYNERYSTNEQIRKVVEYMTSNNPEVEKPTVNDKEMFLRFFEELELMVQRRYLELKDVGDLFSYYFMIVWCQEKDSFFWDYYMKHPYETVIGVKQSQDWRLAANLYKQLQQHGYLTPDIINYKLKSY